MSHEDKINRFEELEAGRILGDLDAAETKEWQELSEELACGPDLSLELAAAAVETDSLGGNDLPDDVADLVRRDIAKRSQGGGTARTVALPATWRVILGSTRTAWAVAALFAILFVAQALRSVPEPGKPVAGPPAGISPEQARDELLGKAGDLIVSDFGATEPFDRMSGKVVWSDALQEGYMTLSNLPANDPGENQYQLWIVDPDRDEKPVDGGVFDIPPGKETAVIPIRNPLAVKNPAAFVITLEQPGGVVVSKQEVVVALAKAS